MNEEKVAVAASGLEVDELFKKMLKSAENNEEYERICLFSDEYIDRVLNGEMACGDVEELLLEVLRLNKALAKNVMDVNFQVKSIIQSLPVIRSSEGIRSLVFHRHVKKVSLSKAGLLGAASTHRKTRALKAWAEQEAKVMRGTDKDIARKLAARIPAHLAKASESPERLIYDHLRAIRKTAG